MNRSRPIKPIIRHPAMNMARKSKSMAANNQTAASPHLIPDLNEDPIELLYEGVMRQPQVCKHQVCDRCGGRFGMVTHRWWGSKFCKRTCKDAYLREVALERDTIRRWFGPWVSRAAQAVGGTPSVGTINDFVQMIEIRPLEPIVVVTVR